ncbi:MFS transporter [Psychrilyobacter atlanticus]|uniref:MFS transporter n=1 Tax=Psychrilyobacter atlanticus TaxID=271091 RepID=UPI0003F57D25|nr:MFS transporter [Psychrilyobacter atlanticus]
MNSYLKNKLIYFPGIFISLLGSVLFSFATGMYLLDVTHQGTSYAFNIILYTIPVVVLSPIFGIFVDRYSKKKLIILGDLLNALLMFGIFYMWNYIDSITLIYTGTVLTSIFSLLVSIGFESGKPQMFEKDWLVKANSLSSIISSGSRIAGPFLGGLIYAFIDIRSFVLFNGISFLFSMITEIFLSIEEVKTETEKKEKMSLTKGFRYMMLDKKLKKYVVLLVILNFSFPMAIIVPIPYLITNYFQYGSKVLGGIQSMFSIGLIIVAMIMGKFNLKLTLKLIKVLFIGFIGVNILFLIPISVSLEQMGTTTIYAIGMFLTGGVIALVDIPLLTYFQQEIPDNIRGQVIGLFIGIIKTIMPIALLLSGKIIDMSTPSYSIILGVIPIAVSLVFLLLTPQKEIGIEEGNVGAIFK